MKDNIIILSEWRREKMTRAVYFIIGIVTLIFGTYLKARGYHEDKRILRKLISKLGALNIIIGILCLLVGISYPRIVARMQEWEIFAQKTEAELQEVLSMAEQVIGEGGKIYMGGQEVRPSQIRLEDYNITIRDGYIIISK